MKEINDLTISISKEHIHCCPDQAEEHGASLHRVLTSLINLDQIPSICSNPPNSHQISNSVKGIHFLYACAICLPGYFLCLYAEQFFPGK